MTDKLFTPLALGPYTLQHRVVMAPLTRMRASPDGNVPTAMNALYYVQRATLEELVAEEEAHADAHIHLPAPSYWPMVLAVALPIMAYGVIYTTWLIVLGGAIAVAAMFGWALEPADAEDFDFDPPADDGETSKELANV